MALQLDVVTPERRVISEAVNSVTVPGRNGEMQILPGHAALISEMQTGVLVYNQANTTNQLHVSGGFIEVHDDKVSVLAKIAERPEEIDVQRAQEGVKVAQGRLSGQAGTDIDVDRAQFKLMRNLHRLQIARFASEALHR
jgi:F-type H+-transporting ATPase subunit epsilon